MTGADQAWKARNDLLAGQDHIRDAVAYVEGWVHQLKQNGWTDDQARAIVAGTVGWRPPADDVDSEEN